MPLIPSLGRQRLVDLLSLMPVWSAYWVPGQPGLHNIDPVFKKQNKTKRSIAFIPGTWEAEAETGRSLWAQGRGALLRGWGLSRHLRALITLPEDSRFNFPAFMWWLVTSPNYSSRDKMPSSGLCRHCTHGAETYIRAKHPSIHRKMNLYKLLNWQDINLLLRGDAKTSLYHVYIWRSEKNLEKSVLSVVGPKGPNLARPTPLSIKLSRLVAQPFVWFFKSGLLCVAL